MKSEKKLEKEEKGEQIKIFLNLKLFARWDSL